MPLPSASTRKFLAEASSRYAASVAEAQPYLEKRGLTTETADAFLLGRVSDPLPGHERFTGMLSIPYISHSGVVAIRFRRIDGDGPKYLSTQGDTPRFFNPDAFLRPEPYICLCEGEIDCMTAAQLGLPAVGLPGVNAWREEFFALPFEGYTPTYILADSDDSGQGEGFAEKVAGQLPEARIIQMPAGHDLNSAVTQLGPDGLMVRLGL